MCKKSIFFGIEVCLTGNEFVQARLMKRFWGQAKMSKVFHFRFLNILVQGITNVYVIVLNAFILSRQAGELIN